MDVFYWVFTVLNLAVSIYTLLCFARILLTWFPGANMSKPGRFLSRICDPYLDWFRRFSTFRTRLLDFTPVIALGVLILVSSIFANVAVLRRITFGVIAGTVLNIAWSIVSSFFNILWVVLLVRLIFNLIKKDGNSQTWAALDSIFNPIIYKISGVFSRKQMEYRPALIVAIISIVLFTLLVGWFVRFCVSLLFGLPF